MTSITHKIKRKKLAFIRKVLSYLCLFIYLSSAFRLSCLIRWLTSFTGLQINFPDVTYSISSILSFASWINFLVSYQFTDVSTDELISLINQLIIHSFTPSSWQSINHIFSFFLFSVFFQFRSTVTMEIRKRNFKTQNTHTANQWKR